MKPGNAAVLFLGALSFLPRQQQQPTYSVKVAEVQIAAQVKDKIGRSMFEVSRKLSTDIFSRIQEEMRSQYIIGYTPAKDDSKTGFRHITLRTRDKNLQVACRSGYYRDRSLSGNYEGETRDTAFFCTGCFPTHVLNLLSFCENIDLSGRQNPISLWKLNNAADNVCRAGKDANIMKRSFVTFSAMVVVLILMSTYLPTMAQQAATAAITVDEAKLGKDVKDRQIIDETADFALQRQGLSVGESEQVRQARLSR